MQATTMPRCSRCPDGGKVTIVSLDTSGVFQPPPAGWESFQLFRCKCGWAQPIPPPDAASIMPQRTKMPNSVRAAYAASR
jgi:hypothetical protein